MRLNLQFRLRTLLAAIVGICLLLGAGKLYFRQFIEAGPAIVGQPFKVRGRFVDLSGNESAVFVVNVSRVTARGRVIYQSAAGRTERRGIGRYDFEVDFATIQKEGEYDLELRPLTSAAAARGKHTEADTIWGRMVVIKDPNSK